MTIGMTSLFQGLRHRYLDDPRQNLWLAPILSMILVIIAFGEEIIFKELTPLIWAITSALLMFQYFIWQYISDRVLRITDYVEIIVFSGVVIIAAVVGGDILKFLSLLFLFFSSCGFIWIYYETREMKGAMNAYRDARKLTRENRFTEALTKLESASKNLILVEKDHKQQSRAARRELRKFGERPTKRRKHPRKTLRSRLNVLKSRQKYFRRLRENVHRDRAALEKYIHSNNLNRVGNHSSAYKELKNLLRVEQNILPKQTILINHARTAEKVGKFTAAANSYRHLSLHGSNKGREKALKGLMRNTRKAAIIESSSQINKDLQKTTGLRVPQFKCSECNTVLSSENARVCSNCGTEIPQCSVCRLPIAKTEKSSQCPKCRAIAHRDHLLEWLHIRSHCPICRERIRVDTLEL